MPDMQFKKWVSTPDPERINVLVESGSPSPEDDFFEVWTEGACSWNGEEDAKIGIEVWFGSFHPENVSCSAPLVSTNNAAEIKAAIMAVESGLLWGVRRLRIFSDFKVLVDGVEK